MFANKIFTKCKVFLEGTLVRAAVCSVLTPTPHSELTSRLSGARREDSFCAMPLDGHGT